MLTDEQRSIVTESFASLVPISSDAAMTFYNHLWEIAPETRAMFTNTDMTQQGLKLMQTLGIAVRALHDTETIVPFLHDLGKRHLQYGVRKDQYPLVGQALLRMVEQCLAEDFTPQMRDAWIAAYNYISEITTSVYEDEFSSSRI